MTWNRFENVSSNNPMPVQEVAGTYNAKEPISATNPLPVMEVEDGAYSNYENVSSANPQPVAIIADSGAYTRYEEYSDTNAFPVKFITGQTYDPRFDVSETNPWPVVVVSSGGGEEYEGPLDIASGAIFAVGQRALSADMRGQPIYEIKRDDATAQAFSSDATTGEAPAAAITTFSGSPVTRTGTTETDSSDLVMESVAGIAVGQSVSGTGIPQTSFVAAINGLVVTIGQRDGSGNPATETASAVDLTFTPHAYVASWKDQSGSDAHVSPDSHSFDNELAQWQASSGGGKPGINNPSHLDYVSTAAVTIPNAAPSWGVTVFMVAQVSGGNGGGSLLLSNGVAEVSVMGGPLAAIHIWDEIGNAAGGDYAGVAASSDGYYLTDYICEFGNNQYVVDGVSFPEDNSQDFVDGTADIENLTARISFSQGLAVQEFILWPGILTNEQRIAIRQNIAAYYGITL